MNKITNFIRHNKYSILAFLIITVCIGIPITRLGIMHNDELMSRYWSTQGFFTFYNHYFIEQIQKGRALSSVIIPFSMFLGYIGKKAVVFKTIQLISIIFCNIFFSKLVFKITKNKKLSLVYIFIFMAFLQISFEPTVPNVFVTFYNVWLCCLFYSLMLYLDYLDNGSVKKISFSMLLLFITMISYESFVTYVPIFLLLFIYKKGFKTILKDKKAILLPVAVGVLYLILYVIFGKIFPSNYPGNQIDGISLKTTIKILYNFSLYSFPGSYLLSDKYTYLFKQYFSVNTSDIIRIIICVGVFIIFLISLFRKNTEKEKNINFVKLFKILFLGIGLVILPILPISVANMYQSMPIGINVFGIPVSFFSYFGSVLIISSLLVYINNKNKIISYIIVCLLAILLFYVQLMNNSFSIQAKKDFNRIQKIENFMLSNAVDKFFDKDIYSKDIFITKNTLYVHDSYWNEFSNLNNKKVNYINGVGKEEDIKLLYIESDDVFVIVDNDEVYVYSEKEIKKLSFDLYDNNYSILLDNNYNIISNYYMYSLYFNNGELVQ